MEYLLSDAHPDGAAKARFFKRFGFAPARWTVLAEALREHAGSQEVTDSVASVHGVKYVVDGKIRTPDGQRPRLRTVWILEAGSDAPRLVTAYPV